jgi:hypothetical protein
MARQRKGCLIWRKSGWNALVTLTVDGERVRKWYPLGTTDRQAAKRKLARLVAKSAANEAIAPSEAANEESFEGYATGWLERWKATGRPESGPIFPVRRGTRAGQFRSARGTSCARRLRRDLLRAGVKRHVCTRKPTIEKGGKRVPNPPIKVGEACCPNMAYDPLFSETAVTRPVDFHSFRRAFSTALAMAGVNAQQAMRLASHSDEKTHMRYVMTTPEMKQIPEAALPKLPLGLLHQTQQVVTFDSESPENSQRFLRARTDSNGRPPD